MRSACPEVLTIEWPTQADEARRLLEHMWEFDVREATREDERRTELYREEFKRQDLRAATLTFEDFINSLQLDVDIAPLSADDVKRAAQLTLRTNQFNFTTIRREEADVQALASDGRHDIRTVRVRDRFGDYGLVGLLIAETGKDIWVLDTFLLSCRVLGRGVEHRVMATLGQAAATAGARAVRLRIEGTKRNIPARTFLRAIAPPALLKGDDRRLECEMPVEMLAAVTFAPESNAETMDVGGEPAGGDTPVATGGAPQDTERLRRREAQIVRAAFTLNTGAALRDAIEGRPSAPAPASPVAGDIAAVVHAAFASALRMPAERVAQLDRLEALGCDSLRIVEITVALHEQFPWLPGTLLFEHRSVSEIVKEISALSSAATTSRAAPVAAALVERTPASGGQSGGQREIAVVGMHARCAGANSPAELWDLLSRGASAVRARSSSARALPPAIERRAPALGGSPGRCRTVRCGVVRRLAARGGVHGSAASRVPRSRLERARRRRRDRCRSRPVHGCIRRCDVRRLRAPRQPGARCKSKCVPVLGRVQPRESPLAAPRLRRPQPRDRHRLLLVCDGAAPRLRSVAGRRVSPRGRGWSQPDPRSGSARLARQARHPVGARPVRAVRRRRGRHGDGRRGRRRRAAAARRSAQARRPHLRRHQGHRFEHGKWHRRVHGPESAGAGGSHSAQPRRGRR